MRSASLSLAVTTFYALVIAYLPDTARLLGPVYAAVIICLWLAGRRNGKERRDA